MRGVFVSFDPVTRSGSIEAGGVVYAFPRGSLPTFMNPQVGDPVNFELRKGEVGAIWAADPVQAPGTYQEFSWRWFLFSLGGRVSLSQFWIRYWLPTRLLLVAYFVGGGAMGLSISNTPYNNILILTVFAILMWVCVAVEVKRWHDRDKSGLWVLIAVVPLVGPIWAMVENGFMDGSTTANRYGLPPLRT